jgi:hypothetical protein
MPVSYIEKKLEATKTKLSPPPFTNLSVDLCNKKFREENVVINSSYFNQKPEIITDSDANFWKFWLTADFHHCEIEDRLSKPDVKNYFCETKHSSQL